LQKSFNLNCFPTEIGLRKIIRVFVAYGLCMMELDHTELLKFVQNNIRILFRPTHSPDLNPIREGPWKTYTVVDKSRYCHVFIYIIYISIGFFLAWSRIIVFSRLVVVGWGGMPRLSNNNKAFRFLLILNSVL
jgi:hypothetical protein